MLDLHPSDVDFVAKNNVSIVVTNDYIYTITIKDLAKFEIIKMILVQIGQIEMKIIPNMQIIITIVLILQHLKLANMLFRKCTEMP